MLRFEVTKKADRQTVVKHGYERVEVNLEEITVLKNHADCILQTNALNVYSGVMLFYTEKDRRLIIRGTSVVD